MAMKCRDQMVVPMIKPPFAIAKLDSHESRWVSCAPEVRASAVSDPKIPTPIDSNTRTDWYVTTMLLSPHSQNGTGIASNSLATGCRKWCSLLLGNPNLWRPKIIQRCGASKQDRSIIGSVVNEIVGVR